MKHILKAAGIVQLLYYILILSYAGFRSTFARFWLAAGGVCIGLSVLPGKWLSVLKYPLGIGMACFCWTEGKIIGSAFVKPMPAADYMIILGARVKGRRPTRSLMRRIREGEKYLRENPGTILIASGGQGPGEEISEAESICDTLASMGISRERMLMETESTNTWENLCFSMKLGTPDSSYVVVTNGFHMYRTLKTAASLQMTRVSGLAASSEPVLLPNYYVREFFALIFNTYVRRGENI